MTDREMLELAARAAGIKGEVINAEGLGAWIPMPGASSAVWNPLDDDGDALRLAVKLGMHLTQYPIYDEPKHSAIAKKSNRLLDGHCVDTCVGIEVYDSDPYAATRRAIVRAAAEIGRQMEEQS
jgi:hypothetical protein